MYIAAAKIRRKRTCLWHKHRANLRKYFQQNILMSKSIFQLCSCCKTNGKMNKFTIFVVVLSRKAAIKTKLIFIFAMSSWLFVSRTCNKVTNTTDLKSSSQHWNLVWIWLSIAHKKPKKVIYRPCSVRIGRYLPSVMTSGKYLPIRTSRLANNIYFFASISACNIWNTAYVPSPSLPIFLLGRTSTSEPKNRNIKKCNSAKIMSEIF